jgi:glycyl-tRNA synthetase (class II)
MSDDLLKKVISHAKEYGFVFPSSEIYDGLSAAYDYGQLGAELKNNIKQYWWTAMVGCTKTSLASTLPFSCIPPLGKLPDTLMHSTIR